MMLSNHMHMSVPVGQMNINHHHHHHHHHRQWGCPGKAAPTRRRQVFGALPAYSISSLDSTLDRSESLCCAVACWDLRLACAGEETVHSAAPPSTFSRVFQ